MFKANQFNKVSSLFRCYFETRILSSYKLCPSHTQLHQSIHLHQYHSGPKFTQKSSINKLISFQNCKPLFCAILKWKRMVLMVNGMLLSNFKLLSILVYHWYWFCILTRSIKYYNKTHWITWHLTYLKSSSFPLNYSYQR